MWDMHIKYSCVYSIENGWGHIQRISIYNNPFLITILFLIENDINKHANVKSSFFQQNKYFKGDVDAEKPHSFQMY